MSAAGGTVALAANWLEPVACNVMSNTNAGSARTTTQACGSSVVVGNTWKVDWWTWPWPAYQPYYVPPTTYVTVAEKVRLKSSEVDRLRAAAKRDAKLKAVLQKFTPLIEVELEF